MLVSLVNTQSSVKACCKSQKVSGLNRRPSAPTVPLIGFVRSFRTTTPSLAKFMRTKEHVNVGTIGHVDHGKTTLTAAITKLLAEKGTAVYKAYEEIDKTPEEKSRGITISASHVEYETEHRHFAHIDCPGHQHYIKNMITGAAQMDTGILLVSAPDGPQEQTKEHLILAREVGIPNIAVFMNKMDLMDDLEMAEMVEQEIRELITSYGFDGAKCVVVKGAAFLALNEPKEKPTKWGREALGKLIDALDHEIPSPIRDFEKPFMMPIEDIFAIAGRGTVITGRIETGTVKIGQEVSIVGAKPIPKIGITGIEMFKKQMDKAQAGDNIGALLRGIKREDVSRGMIACHPGTVQCFSKFSAKIYCLEPDEGGRKKPFGSKYRPQFFLRTANVTGQIFLKGTTKMAMPGDNVEIDVELIAPTPIHEGQRFAMREGSVTVAAGVITKIAA